MYRQVSMTLLCMPKDFSSLSEDADYRDVTVVLLT